MSLDKYVSEKIPEIEPFDEFLLKYSRLVDNVDMFLGPFSELSKLSDSETISYLGVCANMIKGVIKIPFVSLYLLRTKDYTALYDWVPKEIFSYSVPMGSFIDVLRSYEKVTFKHYGLKPFKKIPETKKHFYKMF